ncbi:hypothetical protein F4778DRAFT_600696 [Xylariomycetidae sp. FL2044]|nr:hypothetical protein F4778DRAFT_600696 [Xylariomycetidae sp. FL2044]
MASRSMQERRFLERPSETTDATESDVDLSIDRSRKRRKRDANVYDAVAGRVTSTLPLDDGNDTSATHHARVPRDRHRDPILAPEEVLFRRSRAPVRYAEKDIYYAHESLPDGGRDILPDSDTLKAVHSYASHFYSNLHASQSMREPQSENNIARRNIDERSMDETALLAFGVLLEETGRETLGRKGDLVFTEGAAVDDEGERGVNDAGETYGFLDAARMKEMRNMRR